MKRLSDQLPNYVNDRRGSVAMLFGLAVFVLCGSIALGLDYGRALALRTQLQSAVDSAALGANPNGTPNDPDMIVRVNKNFNYNMQNQKFGAAAIAVTSTPIPQGVRVNATADVPTTFGRLLGINKLPVSVKAEAISAKTNFEIALVLDNTYSMFGSKLADLQAAAKTLVTNVDTAGTPGSVKYALVPFSNYVNIGVANRSATWMSVPKDYVDRGNYCYTTTDWAGCPATTTTGTCYNDGVPYSCSYATCATPGPPQQICYDYSYTHTWYGCAGSRVPAPDADVTASMSAPIPGILDVGCPSELTRLTTDVVTVKSRIDAFVAQGETYIASGLIWGWRVLSPAPPFADAAPSKSNPPTRKVMILMTDGENTKSQWDVAHEGTDTAASDAGMAQLCTLIKAQNIELYTIAFAVSNQQAKTAMKQCATDTAHFFDSTDGAALQQAFTQISGSLIKLSLSR
ncbi:MAG: VWA domain-containing protein [Hyphomicrobiaceae bacterium]